MDGFQKFFLLPLLDPSVETAGSGSNHGKRINAMVVIIVSEQIQVAQFL